MMLKSFDESVPDMNKDDEYYVLMIDEINSIIAKLRKIELKLKKIDL